ncbi:MAG: DcrB-related protein [Deltaproteobacteria bacterium]|nr:DcrB-related protein [Deltaproteobacteria bacterium]
MARHRGPLLSFDYPRDWEDRTEVRYEAPLRRGLDGEMSPGRAVLTTARLAADETLAVHVERHLARLASEPGFVIRSVLDALVDDRAAVRVDYASTAGGLPLEHRALFVVARDRDVAVLTLSSPRTELAQLGPLLDRMLSSVKLGGRD